MRLLNTETYKLREFEPGFFKYAILSHTWGDEELLFSQLHDEAFMRDKARDTQGWKKVKGFCDLALRKGYYWVWIDTCCIDKSSSAELSEAINSMFKWYQNSNACWVYLKDVDSKSKHFEKSFEKSKWFTRGWTLQELIAPDNLQFFDSSWNFIGTRADLCRQVSLITRIPVPLLYNSLGFGHQWVSVAQRMSWASKRETTRSEDKAYCLLGIFNVNMPLLYGEGFWKAFRRLQLEIIKDSNDETLFAWIEGEYLNHGMLAENLDLFDKCGNIQSMGGIPRDCSMTNRGLKIQMDLTRQSPENPVHLRAAPGSRLSINTLRQDESWWISPIRATLNDYTLALLLREVSFPHNLFERKKIVLVKQDLLIDRENCDIYIGVRPRCLQQPHMDSKSPYVYIRERTIDLNKELLNEYAAKFLEPGRLELLDTDLEELLREYAFRRRWKWEAALKHLWDRFKEIGFPDEAIDYYNEEMEDAYLDLNGADDIIDDDLNDEENGDGDDDTGSPSYVQTHEDLLPDTSMHTHMETTFHEPPSEAPDEEL